MRLTIFLGSWGLVGVMTIVYLVSGAINDFVVNRRRAAREEVLEVLSIVLFETDSEASAVHERVLELQRGPLLAVVQSLAVDLDGLANQRLHQLVRSTGLEKFIRSRAESRRWRVRMQAAQLNHLVTHPDFDRESLLQDRNSLVRARTAESMSADHAAEHLDRLLELLSDPSPAVRISAQYSLLRAGDRAVPGLLEHLSDDDDPMVLQALEVAANLPDPRLVEALSDRAESPNAGIRAMAAKVLGNGSGSVAVDVLYRLLSDEDSEVRATSIESLARLEVTSAVTRIGRCLSDVSYRVRRATGLALDELGPSGRLVLRRHLEDPDQFARDMARQVLDSASARLGVSLIPPADQLLDGLDEVDPYAPVVAEVAS